MGDFLKELIVATSSKEPPIRYVTLRENVGFYNMWKHSLENHWWDSARISWDIFRRIPVELPILRLDVFLNKSLEEYLQNEKQLHLYTFQEKNPEKLKKKFVQKVLAEAQRYACRISSTNFQENTWSNIRRSSWGNACVSFWMNYLRNFCLNHSEKSSRKLWKNSLRNFRRYPFENIRWHSRWNHRRNFWSSFWRNSWRTLIEDFLKKFQENLLK